MRAAVHIGENLNPPAQQDEIFRKPARPSIDALGAAVGDVGEFAKGNGV
jgi:hypothetical protein